MTGKDFRNTIAWFGVGATAGLILCTVIGAAVVLLLCFAGCKQSPDDYTYPRRAVQAAQLLRWMERADDHRCFTVYDLIVTSSPPSEVDAMLNRARQLGAGKWANRVTICYKTCLRTVKTFEHRPPNWLYRAAQWSPAHALEIAVYENKIRGCDWLIRDQHGNAIEIYTADHVLTDWSYACPRGQWNGQMIVGGESASVGDSRGLTVAEWLTGPMRENVVLGERFLETYDAFCLDDDPFVGSPSWIVPQSTLYHLRSNGEAKEQAASSWLRLSETAPEDLTDEEAAELERLTRNTRREQSRSKANRFAEIARQSRARTNVQLAEEMSRLPGPALDWNTFDRELPEALDRAEQRAMSRFAAHSMVNLHHYNQACLPAVLKWHSDFVGGLNRKFIMLAQTPNLAPARDSAYCATAHQVFNGSILPSYGFGGYWPRGDILEGWKQWAALERIYHPYGYDMHEALKRVQGVGVCFTECLVKRNWSAEKQRRLARESLAHTLMHDAYFHSAYKDDESGIKYGKGLKDLFTFPEQEFELGKAVTVCLKYYDTKHPDKPLFYRHFQDRKRQYTVVINMHTVAIHGIPSRDAKWFHGLWPRMHTGEVVF